MDDAPRFVRIDPEAEFRSLLERVPALPEQLRPALGAVPVSRDGLTAYRPCEVDLDDGQVVDGVYLVEARSYFSKWGVAPWNDSWKRHVPVERIRDLRDSPTRLPPAIADELYKHGEDGMGYRVFELVLADGRVLACQTGNAVDFRRTSGRREIGTGSRSPTWAGSRTRARLPGAPVRMVVVSG